MDFLCYALTSSNFGYAEIAQSKFNYPHTADGVRSISEIRSVHVLRPRIITRLVCCTYISALPSCLADTRGTADGAPSACVTKVIVFIAEVVEACVEVETCDWMT